MHADVHPLDSVLIQNQQWVVPVYQRHYEWETGEDKQIQKLWQDLQDKAIDFLDKRPQFPHYFGAIIFSELQNQPYGSVPQRFLVDGQQRITTFQLTLVAMREVAHCYDISQVSHAIESYLYNAKSPGMVNPVRERFKLWPSSFDRNLYQDIVENTPEELRTLQKKFFFKNGNLKKNQAPKLLQAFWYLYEEMKAFVQEREEDNKESPEQVLNALLKGFLSGFQIVIISLSPNDDAQEIFASLNGLGKPLSPFDLIRNDVFHRAQRTGQNQQTLFNNMWKPFEDPFWMQQVRQGRLKRTRADHLIAHAVIAETARDVNIGKIATEYQLYVRERKFQTINEELRMLLNHADTYRIMEEQNQKTIFTRIANVLQTWDISTFHPLILWVNSQSLDDEEKTDIFHAVESYIVRREICGLPAKNYNKVTTGIIRHVSKKKGDIPSAFFNHISSLTTGDASRMPTDAQIKEAFINQDVDRVPTPRIRYILQQIEYSKRDKYHETISSENLTIEHIMPRRWSKNWPLPSGVKAPCESPWNTQYRLDDETRDLMFEREEAVYTLGNLTLVTNALNPRISNASWETKRKHLHKSLLVLNRELARKKLWNEKTIKKRATDLAAKANQIWKVPTN